MNQPSQESGAILLLELRERMRQVRRLLRLPTPQNMELGRQPLMAAITAAEALVAQLHGSVTRDRDLREHAHEVRMELRAVTALLDQAAMFHGGLLQAMNLAAQTAILAEPILGGMPDTRVNLEA